MTARRSTLTDLGEASPAAAQAGRRVVLVLVLGLVLLNLGGALGVRTSTVSRSAEGYTLRLDYPSSARVGLDVTWRVQVHRAGGFAKELTLAVTGDYFDIFETQGFFPEPSKQVRDGELLYLTFDAPPGSTFTLDYDAYVQPASQQGRSARLAVVAGGVEVVGVDYTTRLVP